MKKFSEFVNEETKKDFTPVDLDKFLSKSGMERYSLDKNQHGYVRKTKPVDADHKTVHEKLKDAGYSYVHKDKTPDTDGVTHHVYKKEAGAYHNPHTVEITTNSHGIRHVSANKGKPDRS